MSGSGAAPELQGLSVRTVGERGLLLTGFADLAGVHQAAALIRRTRAPWIEEIVPGAETVLVVGAPGTGTRPADLWAALAGPAPDAEALRSRTIEIPVCYDGPDLADTAEAAGLSVDELVHRHSSAEWRAAFLGFSPGFCYLVGGGPELAVPRLATPRTGVPAGSVALAAGMTAVYPQATPGGWRVIGRTDAPMFDPDRTPPALLASGDVVRFRPVDRVGPAPAIGPSEPTSDRPRGEGHLRVVEPGPLLCVQDAGRVGYAHLGVPRAGAADAGAAAAANALVGNGPGAAVLEATLSGPVLRFGRAARVAVTGAGADVMVDHLPARLGAPLELPAGAELRVGRHHSGTRVYVAVDGGVDVAAVLGSRSADTLSGLGPRPLRAGDVVALGRAGGQGIRPAGAQTSTSTRPSADDELVLGGRLGPRQDRLTAGSLAELRDGLFEVTGRADRVAVRLAGPVLRWAVPSELPSEGMVAGSVQVPPDGSPMVMMRNHPTTGGYPVVAVLDDAAIDTLAQSRPGQRVRFDLT